MIERFLELISAEDIMTEVGKLKRADDLKNAGNLFSQYDVVPYPKKGPITGYHYLKSRALIEIEIKNLISKGTNIIELIKILKEKQFCFVLSGTEINGYIHFSDLNKSITKIPLFVLFQAVERRLWNKLKTKINEDDLKKVFITKEADRFIKSKAFNVRRNINIGWTGIFTFPYILRLARFYGQIDLSDSEIKILKEFRNKIAHSDKNMVRSFKEVTVLNDAINLCYSIIE